MRKGAAVLQKEVQRDQDSTGSVKLQLLSTCVSSLWHSMMLPPVESAYLSDLQGDRHECATDDEGKSGEESSAVGQDISHSITSFLMTGTKTSSA